MKRYAYFLLICFALGACRNDDSYKETTNPEPLVPATIEVMLTGRVGSVVGDSLVEYIDALNLLLFRENSSGEYVLYRQRTLDKAQLQALANGDRTAEAGFTLFKEITFDTVPVSDYRIVGIGNVLDAAGRPQEQVALQGAVIGASMADVLAAIQQGDQAPRLFWGITEVIHAGGATTDIPVLRLYRKVAMFSLTLLKIPDVVSRIDMMFERTYGSFNMEGEYTASSDNTVYATNAYAQQVQDSITLNYVMLPTVAGDSTSILATFYLSGGGKQPVMLPEYVLKPNTITKVTATIDPDQAGNTWKVDVNSLITVNVEWNVDQEPEITI